jgi:hypothetical protein
MAFRRLQPPAVAAEGDERGQGLTMDGYPLLTPVATNPIYDTPVGDRIYPQKPPPPQPASASFAHLRKHRPVLVLLPRTRVWMASLPPRVRPSCLATQYARIANLLCATWDHPSECRQYLNDLLIDRRGGRKGFPRPVERELQLLSLYYCVVHPFLAASAASPVLASAAA